MGLVVPAITDLKRRTRPDDQGRSTMLPTLVVLREDRVLALVTAPRMVMVLACAPTFAVGMAPQALVLAAQVELPHREATDEVSEQAAGEGIAYHIMTGDEQAAMAVQRYGQGPDGEWLFGTPVKAAVSDTSLLDQLGAAYAHAPLDPAKVSRKQDREPSPGTAPTFLPAPDGRLAIDAGAAKTAQQKVGKAGGRVLYIAASNEQAATLLGYGMPKDVLLNR